MQKKYQSKYETAKREKQLKGWSHAKKQMLVDGKLGINTCTELAEKNSIGVTRTAIKRL